MTIIASFWVYRPEEHPNAPDYPAMLAILQRSCNKLGLKHVVLTDHKTVFLGPDLHQSIEVWYPKNIEVPEPLMQACTFLQAEYLAQKLDEDVLFVGADSIMLDDPSRRFPEADLCVTSRVPSRLLDAINNGAMLIRAHAMEPASALYRRVSDRCGTVWRDDQKALVAELAPVPLIPGTHERAGMKVAFLPMKRYNHTPLWSGDPCNRAVLLHFRGRQRKKLMFEWARKHGF